MSELEHVKDLMSKLIDEALKRGANYADARLQIHDYELYFAENKVLKDISVRRTSGIGVRVLVGGAQGFASTSILSWNSMLEALERALSIAKSLRDKMRRLERSEYRGVKDSVQSPFKLDPFSIDRSEKAELVLEANKEASSIEGVKNAITRLGCERDHRVIMTSDGANVEVKVVAVGFSQFAVAGEAGRLERYYDAESSASGYEFIRSRDWREFAVEVAKKAIEASRAKVPPAGKYTIVADPDLVGLILHEAFGHASEGDEVESGASVLRNMIGNRVASEHVTIVDEGVVEGGYPVYYDDEGVRKVRTVIVDKGVLKTYLHSRFTAAALRGESTGNARAQDYSSIPLVRQTNLYMLPGDWSLEELIREVREGLLVSGKGSMGGEVNTGMGTFTFSAGPSYVIRNGEVCERVRGVSISGLVLEMLKRVEAVSRDLKVSTTVFGGCGKQGQLVRVGDGGPYILVREAIIGGM